MADILSSIYVLLNILFNGKSKVKTIITVREYKHKFTFIRETGELRYLVLICREYEHKVTHARWYKRDTKKYTYSVEITRVGDLNFNDCHIGHYPLLCDKKFIGTTFPHRCAINAHLDNIFDSN